MTMTFKAPQDLQCPPLHHPPLFPFTPSIEVTPAPWGPQAGSHLRAFALAAPSARNSIALLSHLRLLPSQSCLQGTSDWNGSTWSLPSPLHFPLPISLLADILAISLIYGVVGYVSVPPSPLSRSGSLPILSLPCPEHPYLCWADSKHSVYICAITESWSLYIPILRASGC